MGNSNNSPGLSELMKRESGLQHVSNCVIPVGGGINEYDSFGLTHLHRAILCDSVEDIQKLLAAGADPKVKTKSGWSCLHLAAKTGRLVEMVNLLTLFGIIISELLSQ